MTSKHKVSRLSRITRPSGWWSIRCSCGTMIGPAPDPILAASEHDLHTMAQFLAEDKGRSARLSECHLKGVKTARIRPSMSPREIGWLDPPDNDQAVMLYRFYDRLGALLYVGVTGSPVGRWEGHRLRDWWQGVDQIAWVWLSSRKEALDAEIETIRSENPLFNKTGKVAA